MAEGPERKAENEARFRAANERQRTQVVRLVGDGDALVPFLCECPDNGCTEVVLLTLSEYEAVRSVSTDGLAVDGHEDSTVEHVVERAERYTRTRKTGVAGKAFADLDPRS